MPDGRLGPWLRKRHAHDRDGLLIHDRRCPACQETALQELEKEGGEHQ